MTPPGLRPETFIETLERLTISPIVRTSILTGVLGGYTTFSTFEMETLLLVEQGEAWKAILYVVLSVGLGLMCAFGAPASHAICREDALG